MSKPKTHTGAKTWQNDLWLEIIEAAMEGRQPNYGRLTNFDKPVVSRYGATTPPLLKWFNGFNEGLDYCDAVKPFGFLQVMQPSYHNKELKPVSTYSQNTQASVEGCFDRATGEPIEVPKLKTCQEALAQYHLKPESKFNNANYTDSGITERRHIVVESVRHIGKEANNWEEQSVFGVNADDQIEYGFSEEEYEETLAKVRAAIKRHGTKAVSEAIGLSQRYILKVGKGLGRPSSQTLNKLPKTLV
jgi:hypothetical protein